MASEVLLDFNYRLGQEYPIQKMTRNKTVKVMLVPNKLCIMLCSQDLGSIPSKACAIPLTKPS
jgi:hypothetical protein